MRASVKTNFLRRSIPPKMILAVAVFFARRPVSVGVRQFPFFGLKHDVAKMRKSVLPDKKWYGYCGISFATGSNEPDIGKQVKASA